VTALTRFFFNPVDSPRSGLDVLAWWEKRRLAYNVSVGAAGLVSLGAVFGFGALPPHPALVIVPPPAIVAYGLLANFFYSGGSVLDWVVRKRWGDHYAPVGPALFRYGFAFSVGLTLLPVPMAALSWVVRLLKALS
jgi:hypothetical protein